MRKTPLKRGTKQMKRSGFKAKTVKRTPKKKKRKRTSNGRVVRKSTILGINLNAKHPTYKGITGWRYTGVKGIAWHFCSKYIRQRDGYVCSTCPEENPDTMQAGHYQPMGLVGSNCTLGWDEMNIHCQCKRCNENHGGLQEVMGEYILRKYGEDVHIGLKARVGKVDPVENWEEMIIYYEKKLEKLL